MRPLRVSAAIVLTALMASPIVVAAQDEGPLVPKDEAAKSAPQPPVTVASFDRGGVRATLTATRDAIEVGEPLLLRLEVEAPRDASIRFPSAAAPGAARPTFGEFELRSARLLPQDPRRPTVRVQELEVVCFAAGMQEIPPIELRSAERSSTQSGGASAAAGTGEPSEGAIAVGPLRIEVRSLVGEVDDPRSAMRPVKDAVDILLPRDWRVIAMLAAGALALGAVGYAGWRLMRRAAPPIIVTPQEEARRSLAQLHDEDLPGNGRVLDFYVRLSDIVRRYVERRFGIRAPEQTTKEFLAAASRDGSIGEGHRVLLSGFLRTADRVKFAAERPGAGDCNRAFDAAKGFVEETVASDSDMETPA